MVSPANRGAPWDDEADAELRQRIGARESLAEITARMGRTRDAIRGRAAELHLALRSGLRPWRDPVKRKRDHPPLDPGSESQL